MASTLKVDVLQSDSGPVQIAGGLKFPATQVSSSDANVLDDYEEGIWTPTLAGTLTNPTATYSNRTGRYTKIGRLVHISCYISGTISAAGTGNYAISGLPFPMKTESLSDPHSFPAVSGAFGYLPDRGYFYTNSGSSTLLFAKGSTGTLVGVNWGDAGVSSISFATHFMMCYEAD